MAAKFYVSLYVGSSFTTRGFQVWILFGLGFGLRGVLIGFLHSKG